MRLPTQDRLSEPSCRVREGKRRGCTPFQRETLRVNVSLVDISKAFGERGIAHVEIILETQGRLKYLKDWETELKDFLAGARILPGKEPVIERYSAREGLRVPYRLAVTQYGVTEGRRFQYDKLKAADSLRYHREVTLTPPDAALTFTFAKKGELNAVRSAGWQAYFRRYGDRKDMSRRGTPLRAASDLSMVRDQLRELAAAEKSARIALSELAMQSGALSGVYEFRGEVVNSRENGLRQSIDLGYADRDPVLRQYIHRYSKKPFTKVWFQRIPDHEADL